MLYAFPKLMAKVEPDFPGVFKLYESVKASPKISAYLTSDRRTPFNEHGIYRNYPELDEP